MNPLLYIRAISSLRLRIISWCLRCSGGALLVASIAVPFGERWQQALKIASAGGAAAMVAGARLSSHGASQKHEFEQVLHQQALANFAASLKPPKDLEASLEASKPLEFFDFNRFHQAPDEFPHLLVIGETGTGKTTLAGWLLWGLPGEKRILAPKRKAKQWGGLPVIGEGRNFEAIAGELDALIQTMTERIADLDAPWEFINVAVDELPACNRNIEGFSDRMGTLACEAREPKIRLLALAQGMQVKLLGLEGASDLVDCYTVLRGGKFAVEHCQKLIGNRKLPPDALEWLQSRPKYQRWMVDDVLALVPDLSNWVPSQVPPGSTGTRNPVEPSSGSTLEPSPNQDGTQLEPEFVDPLEPLSEQTVLRVLALHQEGKTQSEILAQVWGVSKGGSKRFLTARDLYRAIVDN